MGARLGGLDGNDSWAIGFGMNSRGAMEIILSLIALQTGLIREDVFVALVIVALFTSIASGPMMNYFVKRKESFGFFNLIKKQNIIFSNARNKEVLFAELASIASGILKIGTKEILTKIDLREAQSSTGIQNYLAIPHAKIKINKPFILIARLEKGIDFEAFDNRLSRIVVLLLTPENKNELQLQLLAEIVNKFADIDKVELLLTAADKNIFFDEILNL